MSTANIQRSVLIVDDEVDVCFWIHAALQQAGYLPRYVTSGSAAMEELRHHRFDVVVTDIFMPEVDGIQIIAIVRQLQPDAVVVAISGGGNYQTSGEALQIAQKLGAKRLLQKPFGPMELVRCLYELNVPPRPGATLPDRPPKS